MTSPLSGPLADAGPVPPDTKDWTWVLERPCEECGYDASTVSVADLPHRIRANAVVWLALMGDPEVSVRSRPEVWSPLEYACHVHDVHQVFHERLTAMMVEHEPQFANWDQDATAVERRYADQVAAIVGPTLVASAYAVGDLYASVPDDDWGRKGFRSDGAAFNIASLGRYHLHDIEHHLHDVAYLADRVTISAYDAHVEEYAAGTSQLPDAVSGHLTQFVERVGNQARVLEIGSGPGRDARELEQMGLSVRRTDISAGFVRMMRTAGYVADELDPLTADLTDPLRGGAAYDGVWANASLLHARREALPVVLGRLAEVTRPGGTLHLTLKEGDGERWSVHGNVGAPRYFTFWREEPLRTHLAAAGWQVDEVLRGESEPADRPSETWLAVFATRA